jgi:hypothetical protein
MGHARVLLAALLVGLGGNVWGAEEWRYASSTGRTSVFVAVNSFRKADDVVHFWTLWDYMDAVVAPEGEVRSITVKHAYRCKDQYQTAVLIKHFGGNVGTGQIVKVTDVPPKWETTIINNSKEHSLFELAQLHCSLKTEKQYGSSY